MIVDGLGARYDRTQPQPPPPRRPARSRGPVADRLPIRMVYGLFDAGPRCMLLGLLNTGENLARDAGIRPSASLRGRPTLLVISAELFLCKRYSPWARSPKLDPLAIRGKAQDRQTRPCSTTPLAEVTTAPVSNALGGLCYSPELQSCINALTLSHTGSTERSSNPSWSLRSADSRCRPLPVETLSLLDTSHRSA